MTQDKEGSTQRKQTLHRDVCNNVDVEDMDLMILEEEGEPPSPR